MVGTLELMFDNGGVDGTPGASASWANMRFRTDDLNTQNLTNPVPIRTGLTKRSYVRSCYLKCTVAPDTKIDNLQIYSDGTGFGTGISVHVSTSFPTRNSGATTGYKVATGTPGDSGTEMVALYGCTKADLFGYTSGSTLTGPSVSESGAIINAQNETTNYFLLQATVIDTAAPGLKTPEVITIQYDEI